MVLKWLISWVVLAAKLDRLDSFWEETRWTIGAAMAMFLHIYNTCKF
jgi:hypothetical protein